jgi:hypothetical protein
MECCAVCSKLVEYLKLPPFIAVPERVSIGTVEELLSSDCKAHCALVDFLESTTPKEDISKVELRLCRPVDISSGVYLMSSINTEHSRVIAHLHMLQQPDLSPRIGRGLTLDRQWIDIDLLCRWKSTCLSQHGHKCESPYTAFTVPRVLPLWLVDTEQLCIVPGSNATDSAFVTLSYVWGDTSPFTTTTTRNLKELQKPGAFAARSSAALLPNTIKNSIDLVPLLKERYLWIDALCIPQDDTAVQLVELNRMAEIYASSVFTIIAGDGFDAHCGLAGIQSVTPPRLVEQEIVQFGPQNHLIAAIFSRAEDVLHLSAYRDRAWTFQESIFAKRRLIFHKGSVRWMCSESFWDEDLLPLEFHDSPRARSFSLLLQDQPYPSFRMLSVAVNNFNGRHLTYPEDALSAITGLLNVLSQTFERGFLFGMPEAFFDIALLWEPTPGMTQRKPKRPSTKLMALLQVPSWSWAAWTGKFIARAWSYYRTTDNYTYDQSLRQVIPTVQWYTMDSPASMLRRKLDPLWFEYQWKLHESSQALPSEWERHYPVKDSDKEQDHTCYFTHPSISGKRWKWPFPLSLPDRPPVIPEPTRYLYCRTSSANLLAAPVKVDSPNASDRSITCSLSDIHGKEAGVLFVHHQYMASLIAPSHCEAKQIELVSVSKTICNKPDGHYDWERLIGILPTDRPYEYYNVLWVGRESGVAYRKGLGRVRKEDWDRLENTDIDLILG